MADRILDCSSTTSAIKSTASLLATSTDRLCAVLREIGPLPNTEAPEHFVPRKVYAVVSFRIKIETEWVIRKPRPADFSHRAVKLKDEELRHI